MLSLTSASSSWPQTRLEQKRSQVHLPVSGATCELELRANVTRSRSCRKVCWGSAACARTHTVAQSRDRLAATGWIYGSTGRGEGGKGGGCRREGRGQRSNSSRGGHGVGLGGRGPRPGLQAAERRACQHLVSHVSLPHVFTLHSSSVIELCSY